MEHLVEVVHWCLLSRGVAPNGIRRGADTSLHLHAQLFILHLDPVARSKTFLDEALVCKARLVYIPIKHDICVLLIDWNDCVRPRRS